MFQSHAPSILLSRLPALRPCQSNGAFVRVGQSKVDAPACRRSQRTCWAASSGKGFGGSSGSGAPPPPETEAEKRELENLRQLAAQAQRAPDRAETAVRGKVRTLQKEFQTKVGMRKVIADKAAELMGKAATDPRLAAAVTASATEAVLRKNPQVSQLDADLLRISKEIRDLLPPGLCALESPSKTYGYVRELNAMPAVLSLQRGNARAQRIAEIVVAADQELRFLSDSELDRIHSEIAAGDSLDAATLRRAAAKILRDFKGTIVEGAQEAIIEDMPALLQSTGALSNEHVALAYWSELEHLLRLSQYATAAALSTFTDEQQIELVQATLRKHNITTQVLNLSLTSMQKRANFLCKCSQVAPKCWVASHFALLHLIERLE